MKLNKLKVGDFISPKHFLYEYLVVATKSDQITVINSDGDTSKLDQDDLVDYRRLKPADSPMDIKELRGVVQNNFNRQCREFAVAMNALENIYDS